MSEWRVVVIRGGVTTYYYQSSEEACMKVVGTIVESRTVKVWFEQREVTEWKKCYK